MTLDELLALCRAELEGDEGDEPETYKSGWSGGRRELAREILGETEDTPPETEQGGDDPDPPEGPRVMIVDLPEGYKNHAGYPWRDGESVLFLGEILNMPGGHCAVVSKDGTVNWAFHTDNFREPTEDEL